MNDLRFKTDGELVAMFQSGGIYRTDVLSEMGRREKMGNIYRLIYNAALKHLDNLKFAVICEGDYPPLFYIRVYYEPKDWYCQHIIDIDNISSNEYQQYLFDNISYNAGVIAFRK